MCRARPKNSRKFAAHHHHRKRDRDFAKLRTMIIVPAIPLTGAAAALTRSAQSADTTTPARGRGDARFRLARGAGEVESAKPTG
jgi:hypothetical protein